jgi:hypothetical protein
VTTSALAATAVTADKLSAGAVTAEKMAAGSITAQNAAIATAAVDTLQIAGQAVTVPAFVSGMTNDLVLNYVIGGTGTFQVFILCSMTMSTQGSFVLTVDGVQIYTEMVSGGVLACKGWALPLAAGNHTIRLRSANASNTNGASIYALATKR